MITMEDRTTTATPMGNALPVEPPSSGWQKFMGDLALGFALMWDRRVPLRVKLVTLALAVGVTACVLAVEIPFEALMIAILSKSGFIGVMTLDGVEAIIGPMIFSCLFLPFDAPTTAVNQIRQRRSN